MRILFETPKYLPSVGGIEINTHEVAKELKKRGHEVSIFCQENHRFEKREEIIDGIKVYRHEGPKFHKSLRMFTPLFQMKNISEKLKDLITNKKIDLIVSCYYTFIKPTKKITKIPVLYIQPSITYLAFRKMAKYAKGFTEKKDNYLKSKVAFFVEKEALKKADFILSRSPIMKDFDRRRFNIEPKKIGVFPQGIDLKKFNPSKKCPLKKKFAGKNIVFSVSRLGADKNNVTLIKVFSKLKTKNKHLILVGDGPQKEDLIKLTKKLRISEKVSFLGEIRDVENYYCLGKVFVLASEQEGFPNVFSEAMASGIPIVGYKERLFDRTVPTRFAIGKRKCGFAVENEEDMVQKIDLILSNKRLQERMAKESRKESVKFSWKKAADKLEEIEGKLNPRVSIIIPCYNAEKYIIETINSILGQTEKNIEVILVDDCSTDNTFQKIRENFSENRKIKVIKNKKNSGAAASINKGLSEARGRYICIFDSDDIMIKNKLKIQSEYLEKNREVDMVFSDMIVWHQEGDGKKIQVRGPEFKDLSQPLRILRKASKRRNLGEVEPYLYLIGDGISKSIASRSAMFRREVFEKIKFDNKLRNAEDYDFLLSFVGHGFKMKHVPFKSYIYRRHSNQKSKNPLHEKNRKKSYSLIGKKLKKEVYFK